MNSQGSAGSVPNDTGFSPWQRLKSKRISYLALPLIVMATISEFVILSIGWRYQKTVCLPQGMGVTFFGIGPIGATILMVELLKLPLAAWTASRHGWVKKFMLMCGLPLICVLTFQLVKDMAVYEMGVALTPASQMLEKASEQEVKMVQLKGELAAIDKKKADRDSKLAELAARKAKSNADIADSLKRNDETRQDAISLTDYQKKELSDVETRQATIIKQADADAAQINKAIADLRARRETELGKASQWNAEDARIENAYKAKMSDYANKKAAYEKAKAEYDNANFLKRKLMREPVDPGVPPVREENKILKPALLAELDSQIKAKEDELTAVNNRRRDTVAQVESDARRLRQDFDTRSTTQRAEADKKRAELLAAQTALDSQFAAEEKQINQEYDDAANKADGLRAELDDARKKAEGFYEAREASIKNTQVFRIATTVEIIRGLIFGKHPISITASAKERGDLYTDQISMVRIWVYPVLAFIVAFLPTLMVEVGFSTVFVPEKQRPAYRMGFLGRRLHWLYTRAGRIKILRAERIAKEASAQIATRDQLITETQANSERALAEKEVELQAAHDAMSAAAATHQQELQKKEEEWVAKLAGMADSLNRTVAEKDALKDLQKSEIERQIQMRQNAWSDRLSQLRQELDDQRNAFEAERTVMMQEHQRKLIEVTEDSKNQVIQARRQVADAELAAVETNAKLSHDLKEALQARDTAESQLKHQSELLSRQLAQVQEDAARELEKALRQEKHRFDRQQLESERALRQRDENFEHQWKQREQELSLAFESRLAEEKARVEELARRREEDLDRQIETRVREVDARWKQEVQQRETAAQIRLSQREQQLQAQADARLREAQTQVEEQLRRRESEFERQLDTQSREAATRLREELQKQEIAFLAKLKQREQELTGKVAARETELQNQWASDLREREEEWKRQAESRLQAAATRMTQEAQQREELFQSQSRQRDLQWQAKLDAAQAELQAKAEQIRKEAEQRSVSAQAESKVREQNLVSQMIAQAEAHQMAENEWKTQLEITRSSIEPLKAQLARAEEERDEAKQSASSAINHVRELEEKLTEASSFLNNWKNGKRLAMTSSTRRWETTEG